MPLLTCPQDNAAMTAVTRNGVEFDVCSQCKGVWLDRGELEKLLGQARAADQDHERERATFERDREQFYRDPEDYRRTHPQSYGERGEYGEGGEGGYRKRKRGFDLFDIFD